MTEQGATPNDFYVYQHIRNDTGDVFYVGKGRKKRAYRTDGRNQYWHKVVNKAGGYSVEYIAKNIDEKQAFDLEIKTICDMKNEGFVLCNLTNGGEGPAGIVPTENHKKKISLSKIGIKRPQEVVEKIAKARRKEMIGNKFGRLTVLEMIGERIPGRHPKWKCVCDCGNETIKTSSTLRKGREPSCGCAAHEYQRKKHDLIGKKFGRLFVFQAAIQSNLHRHIMWKCVCDCGKETIAIGSELRNGHRKSCGCLQPDLLRQANKIRGSNEKQ